MKRFDAIEDIGSGHAPDCGHITVSSPGLGRAIDLIALATVDIEHPPAHTLKRQSIVNQAARDDEDKT